MPNRPMLDEGNAREKLEAAAAALPEYPGGLEGRGVVIPGGGPRYFPCAWVNLNMLRRAGCTLPVELWHLGPEEMSDEMREMVAPLGAACVDALEVGRLHPARILNGWELKCYAILQSRFREVLFLDADNVPVVDPTYLFDSPEYRQTGAIFWPDYGRLAPDRSIWRLTGVPYRDEPEFESGQIVIDKQRCWKPLSLAMWINEHSDFWYRHIHGDKDTFHFAWRKLGVEYAMPPHPIHPLYLPGRSDGVMCQHDFQGGRIFQHRNFGKWTLEGHNCRIPDFHFEKECLHFLDELRHRWAARPGRLFDYASAGHRERRAAERLRERSWVYRRRGVDERQMRFALDGRIVAGAARCEITWNMEWVAGRAALCIFGVNGLTCLLLSAGHDCWNGRWLIHEQMAVDLVAVERLIFDTVGPDPT